MISDFGPPALRSLHADLHALSDAPLSWIAEKHVQYLDDRIHRIDQLTDYLASCDPVSAQRQDFIDFVVAWTRQDAPDLARYMAEYQLRFGTVRSHVEAQCDRILTDAGIWQRDELLVFWNDFALINEIDSLHGMFLTSGRWYVNVMLPIVRELVDCSLPPDVDGSMRSDIAYNVARRVITPRFAESLDHVPQALERRFASLFIPVLQFYDRKLLFLFELMEPLPIRDPYSVSAFAGDVSDDPARYAELLDIGVYPPFAWHELYASRKSRRASRPYDEAVRRLMEAIPSDLHARAKVALECLRVMKEYELNYNNFNYKGRFGLVSKAFYWRTAELLSDAGKEQFLDAILLDRFFEALAVVEGELTQRGAK